jgi:hypothetical protein
MTMTGPTVRVHLLTYRRPALLVRALQSLLAQTYSNWVCELHNDDPNDTHPAQLVRQVADPRLSLVQHPINQGLVRTFNEVFRPVPETYVSVLEDDNTWDPHFLEVMCRLMEEHPQVVGGWANLRLQYEQPDGSWVGDGRCIWPHGPQDVPRLHYWPSLNRMVRAVASQGAMLWRTAACQDLRIPECVSPSSMEAFRERITPQPLLFVPQPLGCFSVTKTSVRDGDTWRYGRESMALAGSFFATVTKEPNQVQQAWDFLRTNPPYRGHLPLMAALFLPGCRFLLRYATAKDFYYLMRSMARHPLQFWKMTASRQGARLLFRWLLPETQQRLLEAQAHGFGGRLAEEWVQELRLDR